MSRNGSGTYSLPSGNPVVTGTTIASATHNTTMSDVATALTDSIAKDGQTTPTANLPMGGFKHTGVASGSSRTDYTSIAQLQDGGIIYVATVGGTADVITLTPSPAISAYAAGQTFRFLASGANTTAVTVNVSGLGAKDVTKRGSTALGANDLLSGCLHSITYDGTRFQLTNPGGSDTVTLAGSQTLTNKSINLANNTVTGTLSEFNTALSGADFVSLAGTETLTNKTLTSPVIAVSVTGGAVADQSDIEAGTATNMIVAPQRMKFHPGVAKAWILWATSGTTITASYNVTSVTNTGTGNETVNLNNNLSSADFAAFASANADGSNNVTINIGTKTASSVQVRLYSQQDSLTAVDSAAAQVVIFGDF